MGCSLPPVRVLVEVVLLGARGFHGDVEGHMGLYYYVRLVLVGVLCSVGSWAFDRLMWM